MDSVTRAKLRMRTEAEAEAGNVGWLRRMVLRLLSEGPHEGTPDGGYVVCVLDGEPGIYETRWRGSRDYCIGCADALNASTDGWHIAGWHFVAPVGVEVVSYPDDHFMASFAELLSTERARLHGFMDDDG